MTDLAVDSVLLMSKEMGNKELSLMCSKGEESGTGVSFVKLIVFYDTCRKRVVARCFGIEQAGNASKDTAMVINHALKLCEYSHGAKFRFTLTMNDAGGGDAGSSLLEHLILVDQAIQKSDHIWGTCTLQLNIMCSVPVETIMGTGGLKNAHISTNTPHCVFTQESIRTHILEGDVVNCNWNNVEEHILSSNEPLAAYW